MDLSKLEKLLNLTQSDNDHEALSAIRRANELLKAAKRSWWDVMRPRLGLKELSAKIRPSRFVENAFDEMERRAEQAHAMDLVERLQQVRKELFV